MLVYVGIYHNAGMVRGVGCIWQERFEWVQSSGSVGGGKWCLQKVDVMSLSAPIVAHSLAAVHPGAAVAGQHICWYMLVYTTMLEW